MYFTIQAWTTNAADCVDGGSDPNTSTDNWFNQVCACMYIHECM